MAVRNLINEIIMTHTNISYNNVKPNLDFTVYFRVNCMPLKILVETVCIFGVLLNSLLLIITSKVKIKRKNYFCLVKSLGWADLLLPMLQAVYPISFAFHVRDNWSGLAFTQEDLWSLGYIVPLNVLWQLT